MSDELYTQVALARQALEKLSLDFYGHHNDEVVDRRRAEEDRKLAATERMAVQVTLANVTATLADIGRRLERFDSLEAKVVALQLEHAKGKGAIYVLSGMLSVFTTLATAWIASLFKH
jgi:hypothetical protein